MNPRELDGSVGGSEPLQHRNERVERVRQDVDQIPRERRRTAAGHRCPGRPKRKMTVDLHRRPEIGGSGQQPSERAIAKELVSGADEPLPRLGEVDERPCVADRQRKGLLDIHVRASLEGRGCGLEVRSRGRADVNDVGPRLSEQGLDRWKRPAGGERTELLGPVGHPIVHADHHGGNGDPRQHAHSDDGPSGPRR